MSVQISLRSMLRQTWVDTLRRVNDVGFLVKQLIYFLAELTSFPLSITKYTLTFLVLTVGNPCPLAHAV